MILKGRAGVIPCKPVIRGQSIQEQIDLRGKLGDLALSSKLNNG